MPGLLLAPYNDSMRLGQGYNSFLQVPCIDNAVLIDPEKVISERPAVGPNGISQVVSYSSRFVEKISDVVRSMNISAGSSIKSGSIEVSGNSISVDESKFAASDLNAVVSIKVINQTTKLIDEAKFRPMKNVRLNNEKFFDIYGDCYISGFIEGGDLHGIVSIKVLDASNKKDVEKTVKGYLNGTDAATSFTLSEGSGSSSVNAALSQTETTITVNWSGGGQIKPESEEWSLDTLFKVAAGFPSRVAACPQRTWAILTKYDNNRDFVDWADQYNISVPQYQGVQSYTSDLLDMYMEYKQNLMRLQNVLANPKGYKTSLVNNPVNITVEDLIKERKEMKREMGLIVKQIDEMCLHPERAEVMEERSQLRSPEVWATRLPIPRDNAAYVDELTTTKAMEELSKFSFASSAPPAQHGGTSSASNVSGTSGSGKGTELQSSLDTALDSSMSSTNAAASNAAATLPSLPPADAGLSLCTSEVEPHLSDVERAFMKSDDNKRKYSNYRFGMPCGSIGGGSFNDAEALSASMVPVSWPKHVEINMVNWGDGPIVGWIKTVYDQMQLTHGNDRGTAVQTLSLSLNAGEYVERVRTCKGSLVWGVEGVTFVEVKTNQRRVEKVGSEATTVIVEDIGTSTKFRGLKGFFGCSGDVVDRIGVIWGVQ